MERITFKNMAYDLFLQAAPLLTGHALLRLALCSDAGYAAAASVCGVWQGECERRQFVKSRYDRSWLDTFARHVRQRAFAMCTPSPWTCSPRTLVTNNFYVQFRTDEHSNKHTLVWKKEEVYAVIRSGPAHNDILVYAPCEGVMTITATATIVADLAAAVPAHPVCKSVETCTRRLPGKVVH